MSPTRRTLREMRGLVFDLDGCVWTGDVLTPGAAQVLALIRQQGKSLCFLTNNSRARARTMQAKLVRLGVEAKEHEVLTPLEILGEVVTERWGPSRVLAIGGPELAEVLVEAGHRLVPIDRSRDATVVVVGNDFDFSYERLTAAARAVAGGAPSSPRTSTRGCPWRTASSCRAAVPSSRRWLPRRACARSWWASRSRLSSSWPSSEWAWGSTRRPWWATAWTRTCAAPAASA